MNNANTFAALKRVKCPDYYSSHKTAIYKDKTNYFIKLDSLADFLLKQEKYKNLNITSEVEVCRNCHKKIENSYNDYIQDIKQKQASNSQLESQTSSSQSTESENQSQFSISSVTLTEEINDILKKNNISLSPLKQPSLLAEQSKETYVNRKRKQLFNTFYSETDSKIRKLYDVNEKKIEFYECKTCDEWNNNINAVIGDSNVSYKEKVKLLTLLPSSMSKIYIEENMPNATSHMIKTSRKLFKSKGMYAEPDPYSGHGLTEETITLVQKYYLNDDFDCSIQSPNVKDIVTVKVDGVKEKKVKRFLTRSVKNIYHIFKQQNPNVAISRTKFYELRPKWVSFEPLENSCLCAICANFDLLVIALKNLMGKKNSEIPDLKSKVLSLITCTAESDACLLQDCKQCPKTNGINITNLYIDEDDTLDEITFAVWEKNALLKKTTSFKVFLDELGQSAIKFNKHNYLKMLQKQEILVEKQIGQTKENCLILHMDFAESWSILMKNAIQSYHWKNDSISIFTAVTYLGKTTKSFVVVSDDKDHDTAHALLCEEKIVNRWKSIKNVEKFDEITKITDGAGAHFKNRFQLFELGKKSKKMKHIFSAPGHGKGPPDGLGSIVKHYASKHNLSSPSETCIQNATEFTEIVQTYVENVEIIHLEKRTIEDYRAKKKEEWMSVSSKKGIRDWFTWQTEQSEDFQIIRSVRKTAKHNWLTVDF